MRYQSPLFGVGAMDLLVYVDRSDIRPGKAAELEAAVRLLLEHVTRSERRAMSYGIYFSDDRATMTVVHVHPDSDSLEQLLAVVAPRLAPFRDLLQLRSIDVYGSPSAAVLERLDAKVRVLGGTITVHHAVAGVVAETLGTTV